MKQLLQQYDLETLISLVDTFFTLQDAWVQAQGYSLVAFRHRLPKLLMRAGASEMALRKVPDKHKNQEDACIAAPSPYQERSQWRFDAGKGQFVQEPP